MDDLQVQEAAPEKKSRGAKKQTQKDAAPVYAEWKCEVKGGKAEKLKLVRPSVKITEQEANVLNSGRLTGEHRIVNLYFPAD